MQHPIVIGIGGKGFQNHMTAGKLFDNLPGVFVLGPATTYVNIIPVSLALPKSITHTARHISGRSNRYLPPSKLQKATEILIINLLKPL